MGRPWLLDAAVAWWPKRASEDEEPVPQAAHAVPRGRLVGTAGGALERVLLHGPAELLLEQPQVGLRVWQHRGPPSGDLGPQRRSMASRYGRTPVCHIPRNQRSDRSIAFISAPPAR